jgi:hypothetical protein
LTYFFVYARDFSTSAGGKVKNSRPRNVFPGINIGGKLEVLTTTDSDTIMDSPQHLVDVGFPSDATKSKILKTGADAVGSYPGPI